MDKIARRLLSDLDDLRTLNPDDAAIRDRALQLIADAFDEAVNLARAVEEYAPMPIPFNPPRKLNR